MKRKTIEGLIFIVVIVSVVIFAGCVEKEDVIPPHEQAITPTPTPTSTPPVDMPPTPAPLLTYSTWGARTLTLSYSQMNPYGDFEFPFDIEYIFGEGTPAETKIYMRLEGDSTKYKNATYIWKGKEIEFGLDKLYKYTVVSELGEFLEYDYIYPGDIILGRAVIFEDYLPPSYRGDISPSLDKVYYIKEFTKDSPRIAKESFLLKLNEEWELEAVEHYLNVGMTSLEDIGLQERDLNNFRQRWPWFDDLYKIKVETKDGEIYYKYVIDYDSFGRAPIVDRGDSFGIVNEFFALSPIPKDGYLVDKHTGKILLSFTNTDEKDEKYGLGPDSSLYERVRLEDSNGKVWYRWYDYDDLLGRWRYEIIGHFENKNNQKIWVPEWQIFIDEWVFGSGVIQKSSLYSISNDEEVLVSTFEKNGGTQYYG